MQSKSVSSGEIPDMTGVFDDDDDDMLIQATGADVDNDDMLIKASGVEIDDDDDADSIDIGAIKKQLMPTILGDEDSNAAGR